MDFFKCWTSDPPPKNLMIWKGGGAYHQATDINRTDTNIPTDTEDPKILKDSQITKKNEEIKSTKQLLYVAA